MPSNLLILCHPLLFLPSVFPSIKVFSNESSLCNRWPKYWSFSFSYSSEYSELISFRIDWLDLLTVQGTLKSLLQHHSSKASVLQHSFFIVQPSHPYMTTGKTIALARRTLVGKEMSLLLKWTGMGEFNSDDHFIYYSGQESLRGNGVAIIVNKRIRNAVLGCNLKNDRMISLVSKANRSIS